MKRANIFIAVFAVLAAVSVAKGEEKPIDFDGLNSGVPANGITVTGEKGCFTGSADQGQPHFAVSDTTVACGGKEYSINAMPIMCGGWVLPPEFAEEILKYSFDSANGVARTGGIVKGFASTSQEDVVKDLGMKLGAVLAELPENIRHDFFDNLIFLDGNLVSAKTDLLEKAVTPAKFEELLNVIMPAAAGSKDIKSVTRRKDEACNASTGAKGREVIRGCDYQPGYTCNPATCK